MECVSVSLSVPAAADGVVRYAGHCGSFATYSYLYIFVFFIGLYSTLIVPQDRGCGVCHCILHVPYVDFVGAQKQFNIGCPSCHHQWPLLRFEPPTGLVNTMLFLFLSPAWVNTAIVCVLCSWCSGTNYSLTGANPVFFNSMPYSALTVYNLYRYCTDCIVQPLCINGFNRQLQASVEVNHD